MEFPLSIKRLVSKTQVEPNDAINLPVPLPAKFKRKSQLPRKVLYSQLIDGNSDDLLNMYLDIIDFKNTEN